MRGATAVINERGGEIVISIHALHARSDGLSAILLPHIPHFNPRSSCEERQVAEKAVAPHYTFQSTLLMRGATTDTPITTMIGKTFQSTLLMRGATASSQSSAVGGLNFNPRSSCEERPPRGLHYLAFLQYFNPRSSCEERRYKAASLRYSCYFNPRSSCEERPDQCRVRHKSYYFNPRSSCEERLDHAGDTVDHVSISIHAPHARSDAFKLNDVKAFLQFQSTLLMRGATSMMYVSPRYAAFQSTLLMRGATTIGAAKASPAIKFQSTLLMRGATRYPYSRRPPHHFNPRSSCEERRHRRSQAQRAD